MSTKPFNLTDILTELGGTFSGKPAGPTIPVTQEVPGGPDTNSDMPIWEQILFGGPPAAPDPFLVTLPPLTPAQNSPIGPLSQFCLLNWKDPAGTYTGVYAWAAKVRDAVNAKLPATCQVLSGDDSPAPGQVVSNPVGIYSPVQGPAGSSAWFKIGSDGQIYLYLEFNMHVTPPTGNPYVVGGFNIALLVRQFLAQPTNVSGVLNAFQASVTSSSH